MAEISSRRHHFPPVVIQHAVWLYLRLTLSYRDVEELLAERRLDISYETVLTHIPFSRVASRSSPVKPRTTQWQSAARRQVKFLLL